MPPPSRSSTNPSPVSPPLGTNVRESYSTLIPHPPRHGLSHHGSIHTISASPLSPMSGTSRSVDSSVNRDSPSSGNPFLPAASMQLDANPQYPLGVPGVPPFDPTKLFCPVTDAQGTPIQVDIQAKIDKGFFKADTDWTCYRRNYFSVLCCYILKPDVDLSSQPLFLSRTNRERIQSFSVLIVAKVDSEEGKSVELVQHTPKRDKGPMTAPELTELSPYPWGGQAGYGASSSFGPSSALNPDFENFSTTTPQNQSVATFDRIQFKKATANNGKRRAAQQYFHIVVELWAKVPRGKSGETQNVKIAHRLSAPMVVRGRSPGHYSDERRGSMGPGSGSGAEYSPGQGNSGTGGPSGDAHSNRGGVAYSASGHMSTGGYQPHQMSMANSPSVSNSIGTSSSSSLGSTHDAYNERRAHPSLTMEEAAKFDEYEGYQYYPSPLYEISPNQESSRPNLPLLRHSAYKHAATAPDSIAGLITTSADDYYSSRGKVKPEQSGDTRSGLQQSSSRIYEPPANMLPLGGVGSMLRHCRRFQGTDTSNGYYPATPAL